MLNRQTNGKMMNMAMMSMQMMMCMRFSSADILRM